MERRGNTGVQGIERFYRVIFVYTFTGERKEDEVDQ